MKKTVLLGSIDQGTQSTRFYLFKPQDLYNPVAFHQEIHKQIYPNPGWVEHDAAEILTNVKKCITETIKKVDFPFTVAGVGITNQRETIVVWDKNTGKPLCNCIVWSDTRTEELAKRIIEQKGQNVLQNITGLPISTYFTGVKLRWLVDNDKAVREAVENRTARVGTIDSWLVWNLTGKFVTDVTNASRTLIMDLKTAQWSPKCTNVLKLPKKIKLPDILSTCDDFGKIKVGSVCEELDNVPISGVIGDQQAAMVGQQCFRKGEAKNTYGTGCFMLSNIGEEIVISKNGLLTTALFKNGSDSPLLYALEGSIPTAGVGIEWVKKIVCLKNVAESETVANEVKDCGGVYFVPAFSGLFAPHWRSDARGTMFGLTGFTERGHICRAMLEGVCFQTKEVLEAMEKDSNVKVKILKVDGGMTENKLLMQTQSDLLNIKIEKPKFKELTAVGAAICAGLGCGVYKNIGEIRGSKREEPISYSPQIDEKEIEERFTLWKRAVEKSKGWIK